MRNFSDELYHFGIKGMKWGIRRTPEQLGHKKKSRKQQELPVTFHKKGESVTLRQEKKTGFAKLLSKMSPSLQKKINDYKDFSVLNENGDKVGIMSVNKDSDDSLNLVWVQTNKKHEGQGYGQSTMRTLVDYAKKNGFKEITLEVPETSPNARHIYEKMGFKEKNPGQILGDEDDVWGGLTEMVLTLDKKKR